MDRMRESLEHAARRALPGLRAEHVEATVFRAAYRERPWVFTPEYLGEMDAEMLAYLVDQMQYEEIGMLSGEGRGASEQDRLREIERSRFNAQWDPVTQQALDLATNFGFGLDVTISCKDEAAQAVLDEFWTAKRNRPVLRERNIHRLSRNLQRDGELVLVGFVSTLTGDMTVRTLPPEQITALVTDPNDAETVLFYRREWTPVGSQTKQVLYYPDWEADDAALASIDLPPGAERADQESTVRLGGTAFQYAAILMLQVNEFQGRGWPTFKAGAEWSKLYRQMLHDRAAVVRKRAMYTDTVKLKKGGARALSMVQARLQSSHVSGTSGYETNPPAIAGSDWLENDQIDRVVRNLGNSGAQDAERDANAVFAMATLSSGAFPHYFGRGDTFRLATATAMELPTLKHWQRYQKFWADAFRDLTDFVLTMKERFGSATFDTHECDVSQDAMLDVDPKVVLDAARALDSITKSGAPMDENALGRAALYILKMALQALGESDVEGVLFPDPEEMGPGDPTTLPKPEPPVQLVLPPVPEAGAAPEAGAPEEEEEGAADPLEDARTLRALLEDSYRHPTEEDMRAAAGLALEILDALERGAR